MLGILKNFEYEIFQIRKDFQKRKFFPCINDIQAEPVYIAKTNYIVWKKVLLFYKTILTYR